MLIHKTALTLAALAPLLSVPAPVAPVAQQPTPPAPKQRASADLVLEHFVPKCAPASKLATTAYRIAGFEHAVPSDFTVEPTYVRNIVDFGDSVLLYDTPAGIAKLTQLLEKLDLAFDANTVAPPVTSLPIRHLSRSRVSSLLYTFYKGSYEFLGEQNTVLLRGSEEDTERAVDLLVSVDFPSQQVLLSCYLIQGTPDPQETDEQVPPELAEHLSKLLPYAGFELQSLAILRTAALPIAGEIEMCLERGAQSPLGVLRLTPGGFEPNSKSLTLDKCSFGYAYAGATPSTIFKTSTSVTAGEYTVLGATGLSPVFVVLRFELL